MRVVVAHNWHLSLDPYAAVEGKPYPPLGTAILAAMLRERGHEVVFHDATFADGPEAFAGVLDAVRPDRALIVADHFLVPQKMCLDAQRRGAFAMLSGARTRKIPVLIAGPDASDRAHEYLAAGADVVVRGEPDASALAWADGAEAASLPGAVVPGGAVGDVARPMTDLGGLPSPAWDLLDLRPYADTWRRVHGAWEAPVSASRGCPYRCNWCAKPIWGRRIALRPVADVLADVAQLERAGVPFGQGGYVITTTLDPALQRAATAALVEGTAAVEARPGYRNPTYANHSKGSTDYLQGMVIALDPATGDVRALVGGRNYAEGPFNRAVNGQRQPGSAFKPIVYARAIMDSIPANAIVPDTSLEIAMDRGNVYRPKNSDGEFLGNITLREALVRSRNPVAVQLWQRLTGDSVIALARRLGIRSYIAPWPSSAIGASAVQPLDLVAAFTAFPNLGTPMEPRFIYRAEDATGRSVFGQAVRALPPAMSAEVAFITRDLMRDVVDRGTANAVRRSVPYAVPVAGKTGTTDDNTDVWFIGATTDLVAGVWLGFDKPRQIMSGAAGGTLAAPIFGQMLARSNYGHGSAWTPPPGIVTAELDRDSGKLAEASTPPEKRYLEYFLAGTEPGALRVDARRLFGWGPIP